MSKKDEQDRISFLEKLLSLMPGNVFWKDVTGKYWGCNNNVAQILNLNSPQEIVGKFNEELFDPALAEKATQMDEYVIETGLPQTMEEIGVNEAGEEAIYFTTKTPIFDDDTGEVVGLLGVSLDVTAEREAQALRVEKEKMEQGAEFLRVAMGAIAHDLRTPLASVRFVLDAIGKVFPVLLEGYELALNNDLPVEPMRHSRLELFKGAIERGMREIKFANSYIDLTLANVRHDRIVKYDYQTLDIVAEVTKALEAYPFKDDQHELVTWRPMHDFQIFGNEFYFRNILNNLLKNAIFFIQKNRKGVVELWTGETNEGHFLYVKDTAEGVPEELADKIFDGYFTKRQNGTGLGLTFCKSAMQEFGGDIVVESVYGEYMQFNLCFPKDITPLIAAAEEEARARK